MSKAGEAIGHQHAESAAQFDMLARRFRPSLIRFFGRRVHSPDDAEELAHEVFVRLLRRADLTDITDHERFVFVTAGNLLKDYYRSKSRRLLTQPGVESLNFPSDEPNSADIAEGREELRVLIGAIKELPPKCRVAFVLHKLDQLPYSEIAQHMSISVSMVEKHIATALLKLRATLRPENSDV